MNTNICINISINMNTHINLCIDISIHINITRNINIDINTYIYIYIYTCIHRYVNNKYTYKYTCKQLQGSTIGGIQRAGLSFSKIPGFNLPQTFAQFTDFTSTFHLSHLRNQKFTGHPCVVLDHVIPEHVEVL